MSEFGWGRLPERFDGDQPLEPERIELSSVHCNSQAVFVSLYLVNEREYELQSQIANAQQGKPFDSTLLERIITALYDSQAEIACDFTGQVPVQAWADDSKTWTCPRCGSDHTLTNGD